MTLAATCGQLLVCGFAGERPSSNLQAALERGERAGVILFKRNIGEMEALARADWGPIVSIDQEGGRVARLGAPVVRVPPAMKLATLAPDAIERVAKLQSEELAALGFTMNFAPVLDVHSREENPVIGDRSFGRTPEDASRAALAFARGMASAKIAACGKHFPGHGDTTKDSHFELPVVDADRARLDAIELAPFRDAIRARIPSLMTAHVVYPALGEKPATIEKKIATDLVRRELGFEGVLVSDDLEMKAIADKYGPGDAAVLAIEAGCDLLLVCSQEDAQEAALDALVRRSEKDPAFHARILEANARVQALVKMHPRRASFARFREIVSSPEANEVARILESIS